MNLDPWVQMCNNLLPVKIDTFDDEMKDFKIVNIASYFCTRVTEIVAKIYCKSCNIPEELWNIIEMKNEFLFKRLVLYKNTKKNYAAHTRLQEGKIIDEISTTGIKLKGSSINPAVQQKTNEIIESKMLRSKIINPIEIIEEVHKLEEYIKELVRQGDITIGKRCRYSGPSGYKTGVYQNAAGRSAIIWNLLVPNDSINPGDYAYMLRTTVNTIEDCEKIEDVSMRNKIKDKIFGDANLKKYGLSMICIPKNGTTKTIPAWLIPIVDYDDLISKHLQPLVSLLPSLGIYMSKVNSTHAKMSSIISF
jgi:hypothetical protein